MAAVPGSVPSFETGQASARLVQADQTEARSVDCPRRRDEKVGDGDLDDDDDFILHLLSNWFQTETQLQLNGSDENERLLIRVGTRCQAVGSNS